MKVRRDSQRELTEAMHPRYLKASRAERGRMLDQYVAVTGYHRKYPIELLRHGPRVVAALKVVAQATGWICGKRLVAALPELVPALEREGALQLSGDTYHQAGEPAQAPDTGEGVHSLGRAASGVCGDRPGGPLWGEHSWGASVDAGPDPHSHRLD